MIQVNPFISKVIGVVVVLIVIVSVAVPVISTLTQPETITNDYELRYSVYDATDVPSFTIEVDSETQTITMNDEEMNWPAQASGYRAVILTISQGSDPVSSIVIDNNCKLTDVGASELNDGRIEWNQDTKTLRGYSSTGSSRGFTADKIIMPDPNGNLGSFSGQFWGAAGGNTYMVGLNETGPNTVAFSATNNEIMTGKSGYNYTITNASIDKTDVAYEYDVSNAVIDYGPRVNYNPILAIGDIDIVVEESNPIMDMINLVPLLLVVGLIIAAVAAFITLKSRGGGA